MEGILNRFTTLLVYQNKLLWLAIRINGRSHDLRFADVHIDHRAIGAQKIKYDSFKVSIWL